MSSNKRNSEISIENTQAVILAGGLGTRLRPLTYEVPKPMVTVRNKPYLYYQLLYLKKFAIRNVLILIGYLGEHIKNYFDDGSKFGLSIKYSVEEKPLGTGGALKKAECLLGDNFFLINGDSFLPVNYKEMFKKFKKFAKKGLLALYNNTENTLVKSNIVLNKDLNIIMKYEKNGKDEQLKYVDAGVSVFQKNVLDLIKSDRVVSLEEEIFPVLIKQKELAGFITNQRFYDIGTQERLKKFEEILDDYFPDTISN